MLPWHHRRISDCLQINGKIYITMETLMTAALVPYISFNSHEWVNSWYTVSYVTAQGAKNILLVQIFSLTNENSWSSERTLQMVRTLSCKGHVTRLFAVTRSRGPTETIWGLIACTELSTESAFTPQLVIQAILSRIIFVHTFVNK